MFKQLEEYLVGLLLKPQFHAVLAQFGGSQIKLEYAEAVDGIVLGRHNQPKNDHKLSASLALLLRSEANQTRHICV